MQPPSARPGVPHPPADPGLPGLPVLLDRQAMAERLGAYLMDPSSLTDLKIVRVTYQPGVRCQVTYAVTAGGHRTNAVATAAPRPGVEMRLPAAAGGSVRRLSGIENDLGATIHWLPADPWLPQLAGLDAALPGILADAGVTFDGAPAVTGYRAGERAVAVTGGAVIKLYSDVADVAHAVSGFRWALAAIPAAAPRLLHTDLEHRLTVQSRVTGEQLDHAAAVGAASVAGDLLAQLHRSEHPNARRHTAADLLARAVAASRLAGVLCPELALRATAVADRLTATHPSPRTGVGCHGDFNVSQMIRTASGISVLDFDEHCVASPSHDLAAYVANVVSGREADAERAAAADAALVDGYGTRPGDFAWYLAASILCRAPSPFRLQKRNWPARTERIVAAAEGALR